MLLVIVECLSKILIYIQKIAITFSESFEISLSMLFVILITAEVVFSAAMNVFFATGVGFDGNMYVSLCVF